MKKKFAKSLSLALAGLLAFSSVPVKAADFVYETDANGFSKEYVEYQSSDDEDFSNQTAVFAQIGSEYKVTIPKVIVLSGVDKQADYFVKVSTEPFHCILWYSNEQLLNHSQLPGPRNKTRYTQNVLFQRVISK